MNENYEQKISVNRIWKKVLCILLSVIIGFGTFVTMTFGNLFLSDYVDFKSWITAYADTSSVPIFYRHGELVGLYKTDYLDNTVIQYKIGEDGEWTDYTVPFAVPAFQTTKVYARIGAGGSIIYTNLSTTNKAIGVYTEENTDFDFSYNNINFGYTRIYNSADKKWFESTESKACAANGLLEITLPDSTEYKLIRTDENTYIDELTGNTATVTSDSYIFDNGSYKYYFDNSSTSYLNAIEDNCGNRFEISREIDLIRYSITDGSGRSFSRGYDEYIFGEDSDSIYFKEITDPNGNKITYTSFSADPDQCNEVVDQAGVIIGEYEYKSTSDNTLVRSMDKSISYYDNGRLKKIVYDDGSYISYNYDDENMTYTTLSSSGETTKTVYNDAFLPVEYTDEYGTITAYTYDAHYRVLTETSNGITTAYTYDNNDNLLSSATDDEEDNNTYYTYDSNGNVVREQTGDSYTYYTYNNIGNVLICASLKEDYSGEIPELYDSELTCFDKTEYTYDSNGRVTKEEESLGNTTEYEYDSRGNVTRETSTVTENEETKTTVTTYTYDSLDNVLTTQCDSDTSSYIYDEAGRTLLSNESGECTRTLYDEYGRTVQEIAPEDYDSSKDGLPEENTYSDSDAGHRYVYNDKNQLVKEINRLDVVTDYEYYSTGEKKAEVFDIYRFEYNVKGSPTKTYVSGVNTLTYTYDDNNNLTSEVYANGDVIRYTYNDAGNLTAQYRDENTTPYVTYSYNTEGELSQKINSDTGLKYVYGENNSVSVYKTSDNTLVQSYTETVTEADEENSVEARTDITETYFGTSCSSVIRDKSISYTIGSNTVEYSYETNDEENIISDLTLYNESESVSSDYTYDDAGNITSRLYTYKAGGGENETDFITGYDSEGRITGTGYDYYFYEYYTYDSSNQIVRADNKNYSAPYTSKYEYDSRGNVLSINIYDYTRNETVSSSSQGTVDFTYANSSWKDQLTAVNGSPLTYDANGNVLTYGSRSYTWTDGRKLTSISQGSETYSYTYDEEGIRTSKTVNGVTTYYNTRDGVILSQTDGTNTMYFQYDTSGIPLGFTYNGEQYFYLTNNMGDVIAITYSDGEILAEYVYDEWGNVLDSLTGMNTALEWKIANVNPLRYRGYYYDEETGYYYLQSRYYDPSICRFINADDTDYVDKDTKYGTNIFAYCDNDPINKFDLLGFWGADIHYGRKNKKGKNYDGTYEWAIFAEYKSKYATKIAEGDLDMDTNKNTTPNPLRAINADTGLANRQKYHFNRAPKGKTDTRIVEGNNFYKKAVSLFKSAIKTYNNNKAKLDKQFLNKNNSQYKSLLSSLQKERDKKISSACFTLGKALHCFQDIYAHGNITAGPATGKYTYRLNGHFAQKGVDNPYFNWKSGSGKTQVVETKKLTQRYYDTQDKSLTMLLTFLYDVNYSSLIKVK